jgi:protocatechuate 3,4-dioxygenase beta subunit
MTSRANAGRRVERRTWLAWLATALPAGVAACGGSADGSEEPNSTDASQEGAVDVDGGDAALADGNLDGAAEAGLDASETGTACVPTGRDALGPFHEPGAPYRTEIAGPEEPGARIRIVGVVLADDCVSPVADAVLDIWHADADGVYHSASQQYRLRGQVKSDGEGRFAFDSILPGNYADRPRHVHFIVSAPGFQPLTTQLYFADDPFLGPNDSCQPPTCDSSDPDRITQLVATPTDAGEVLIGTFEVRLSR